MSEKSDDCGHHPWYERHHKFLRRLFRFILLLLLVVLIVVFVVWLVLRPTKPKFLLLDASVLSFNLSTSPSLLTATIQVSISSRNPNDRIGIYYDRLNFYASYKSQQITIPSGVAPFYQGHNDVSQFSPFLQGASIPMAPYLSLALNQDENAGSFVLQIKVDGRVRWKVGSWVSGSYHLFVNCPAYLTFDTSTTSGCFQNTFCSLAAPAIKFRQISKCSVNV